MSLLLAIASLLSLARAEVHVKTIEVEGAAEAARIAEVNFQLIKGLYAPRKNPYEGEITSLIKCDKNYSLKEFSVSCPQQKEPSKALAGGAGARFNFGICSKVDLKYAAAYFSCYDPGKKRLTEVRAFQPFDGKTPWSDSVHKLQAWVGTLPL